MSSFLLISHIVLGISASVLAVMVYLDIKDNIDGVASKKAKNLSLVSFILIILSWVVSGFYYINIYGPSIRNPILDSSPWVHLILMESKEHIFLFLPFLITQLLFLIRNDITSDIKKYIKITTGFIFLFCIYMIVAGVFISQAKVQSLVN